MELYAAHFCRGSTAMHNEQLMPRPLCYQRKLDQLLLIIPSSSEVGQEGKQVVAEGKGEK